MRAIHPNPRRLEHGCSNSGLCHFLSRKQQVEGQCLSFQMYAMSTSWSSDPGSRTCFLEQSSPDTDSPQTFSSMATTDKWCKGCPASQGHPYLGHQFTDEPIAPSYRDTGTRHCSTSHSEVTRNPYPKVNFRIQKTCQ